MQRPPRFLYGTNAFSSLLHVSENLPIKKLYLPFRDKMCHKFKTDIQSQILFTILFRVYWTSHCVLLTSPETHVKPNHGARFASNYEPLQRITDDFHKRLLFCFIQLGKTTRPQFLWSLWRNNVEAFNWVTPVNCTITANQLVKPKIADTENLDVGLRPWRSILNLGYHTSKVDYYVMKFVYWFFLTHEKIVLFSCSSSPIFPLLAQPYATQ